MNSPRKANRSVNRITFLYTRSLKEMIAKNVAGNLL
jgi:hypothetical protein